MRAKRSHISLILTQFSLIACLIFPSLGIAFAQNEAGMPSLSQNGVNTASEIQEWTTERASDLQSHHVRIIKPENWMTDARPGFSSPSTGGSIHFFQVVSMCVPVFDDNDFAQAQILLHGDTCLYAASDRVEINGYADLKEDLNITDSLALAAYDIDKDRQNGDEVSIISLRNSSMLVVDEANDTRLGNMINDNTGAGESDAAQRPPTEAIIANVSATVVEYHQRYYFEDENDYPTRHVTLYAVYNDTGYLVDYDLDEFGNPATYSTVTDSDIQKMLTSFEIMVPRQNDDGRANGSSALEELQKFLDEHTANP